MTSEKKLDRHITVRIPRSVASAVNDFLETNEAARMGFDSKADVVTAAIRNLLTEYGHFTSKKGGKSSLENR
jgi:hypothetical protein